MKKGTLVILLLLNFAAFAQYAPFKKYNFNHGGYSLLGTSGESDYNELAAKLGEFYTDDIKTLNEIKNEWVFTKKSPRFSCGYHYTLVLLKNGKVLEGLNINLNCAVIASDKGYYFFDSKKLSFVKDKFRKPIVKKQTFKSVTEARNYLAKIGFDKNVIMMPRPDWENYDGEFSFSYKFKSTIEDNKRTREKLIKKLHDQISKAYPKEPFNLQDGGGSNKEMLVQVTCKSTLKDKFRLYPIEFSWNPYSLNLTTYSFQRSDIVVRR